MEPGAAQMIEILPPDDQPFEADDPQFARILQILGAQKIPHVNAVTLSTYLNYLKAHLQLPCLVSGIESIGYFGWEERFQFGYGSEAEYKKLRQEYGSLKDEFELKALEGKIQPGRICWSKSGAPAMANALPSPCQSWKLWIKTQTTLFCSTITRSGLSIGVNLTTPT